MEVRPLQVHREIDARCLYGIHVSVSVSIRAQDKILTVTLFHLLHYENLLLFSVFTSL